MELQVCSWVAYTSCVTREQAPLTFNVHSARFQKQKKWSIM